MATDRDGSTALVKALPVLLLLYAGASFAHFAHNAEFLADYPNLPSWLTRAQVYAVRFALAGLGVLGYVLIRVRHYRLGLVTLAVYAAVGLDGLLHYTRAPFAAHSAAMNATILAEVAAAGLVLFAALALLLQRPRN